MYIAWMHSLLCFSHYWESLILFYLVSLHSFLFSSGTGSISLCSPLTTWNCLHLLTGLPIHRQLRRSCKPRQGEIGKEEKVSGGEREGPANCALFVSSIGTRCQKAIFHQVEPGVSWLLLTEPQLNWFSTSKNLLVTTFKKTSNYWNIWEFWTISQLALACNWFCNSEFACIVHIAVKQTQ